MGPATVKSGSLQALSPTVATRKADEQELIPTDGLTQRLPTSFAMVYSGSVRLNRRAV
jgi:hypothetical protein